MVPTLERVAGKDKVFVGQKITGYEDFSYYQQKIPAFSTSSHHAARSGSQGVCAESFAAFLRRRIALLLGVRSLAHLTLDYMASPAQAG